MLFKSPATDCKNNYTKITLLQKLKFKKTALLKELREKSAEISLNNGE